MWSQNVSIWGWACTTLLVHMLFSCFYNGRLGGQKTTTREWMQWYRDGEWRQDERKGRFVTLFPDLPRFCSLVCVQYNTQKWKSAKKTGKAWEQLSCNVDMRWTKGGGANNKFLPNKPESEFLASEAEYILSILRISEVQPSVVSYVVSPFVLVQPSLGSIKQ